jgi:hypothetical protein
MIFNSAVAGVGYTDSESNKFFVFLRKVAAFEGFHLNFIHIPKCFDAALLHLQVILLPQFPDFRRVDKHFPSIFHHRVKGLDKIDIFSSVDPVGNAGYLLYIINAAGYFVNSFSSLSC